MKNFYRLLIIFLLTIFLTIGILPVFSQIPTVNLRGNKQVDVSSLLEQSKASYEQGNLAESIEVLSQNIAILRSQNIEDLRKQQYWQNLAIALIHLGHLQLAIGQPNEALKTWQEAEKLSQNQLKNQKAVIITQIYQAQALQNLGNYPLACKMLINGLKINSQNCDFLAEDINKNDQSNTIQQLKDLQLNPQTTFDSIQITGWHSLGDILRSLGKLKESQLILEKLIEKISLDSQQLAATQLSLGNTFRAMGNLERDRQAATKYDYIPWRYDSEYNLSQCSPQQQKTESKSPQQQPIFCKELSDYYQRASKSYQKVILTAQFEDNSSLLIKAQLNALNLYIDQEKAGKKTDISNINLDNLFNDIKDLPLSQNKIYSYINYSKTLTILQQINNQYSQWEKINQYLTTALQETEDLLSKELANQETKSYILGNLGSFYEYRAWWLKKQANKQLKQENRDNYSKQAEIDRQEAIKRTQDALYLAQPSDKPYLAYQWQWQLGRLLEAEGKREEAITYYEAAADTLKLVRSDLLAISSDVQFNFRDNVEPLYRQLVNLLLQSPQPTQQNLQSALDLIDSLRLAELQNFLGCDPSLLTQDQPKKIEDLDDKTALIYPLILQDRLEIILKLPSNNELLHYCTTNNNLEDCHKIELDQGEKALDFQILLDNIQSEQSRKTGKTKVEQYSKELYQWLIKPLESDLRKSGQIQTLVFLLDGSLRNISLATLIDSQGKYLIENYALATLYSRNFTQQNFNSQSLNVITAGITDEQNFAEFGYFNPLPGVETELNEIQKVTKSKGDSLLNQSFTVQTLQNKINNTNASILHIATHGNFDSDPNKTFIVAWNTLIKAADFDDLLQRNHQPENSNLKLLVLSACKTADGDRRAALGLAGIAVKAGVNTALASLWTADDQATAEFMPKFYENLTTETNIAIALQKTQIYFLKESNTFKAPYYWSQFIIVGNWLK